MQALWMALGALFFALMGVCIKLASHDYASTEIVFYRGLTGIVIFSILMKVRGIPLTTPVPKLHFYRNIAGVTSMSLWFYAIANLPFATGMTMNNLSSVWLGLFTVAMTWYHTRRFEQPGLLLTVITGFIGVVLLLNPRFDGTPLLPGLLGVVSSVFAATAYMQVSALGKAGEPEDRTVFYFSIGTAILGLLSVYIFDGGLNPIRWESAWLLPATGVFASLGQWCLTRAYTSSATLLVACLQYLGIVYSALFSLFFFNDQIRPWSWLGLGLILASGLGATLLRFYGQRARKT